MGNVEPRQLLENSDDARTPATEPRFLRGRRTPAIFKGETSNYYIHFFYFMMIIIPPRDKIYIKVKPMKRYAPQTRQKTGFPRSQVSTHSRALISCSLAGWGCGVFCKGEYSLSQGR